MKKLLSLLLFSLLSFQLIGQTNLLDSLDQQAQRFLDNAAYQKSWTINEQILKQATPCNGKALLRKAKLQEHFGFYFITDSLTNIASAKFKKCGNQLGQLDALNYQAYINIQLSRLDIADSLLSILELELKDSNTLAYATMLDHRGLLLVERGKYKLAEKYYLKTLSLQTNLLEKDHLAIIKTKDHLGEVYLHQKKYKKAENYYTWLSNNFKKDHPYQAIILNNQGRIFIENGNFEKAEISFEKSLKIIAQYWGKEHPKYARGLLNFADYYRGINNSRKLLELIENTKRIYEAHSLNNTIEFAYTINLLAIIYLELGQEEEIKNYFLLAAQIFEKHNIKNEASIAFANQGLLLRLQWKEKESLPYFAKALEMRNGVVGKDWVYAKFQYMLAESYFDLNQLYLADSLSSESLTIYANQLSEKQIEFLTLLATNAKTKEALGKIKEAKDGHNKILSLLSELLQYYYPSLIESERLQFFQTVEEQFTYVNSFLFRHPNQFPDLQTNLQTLYLQTKALALESSFQNHHLKSIKNDKELSKKYKELINQKTKIRKIHLAPKSKRSTLKDSLTILVESARHLEKELSKVKRDRALDANHKQFTYNHLSTSFDSKTASIDFIRYEYFDEYGYWADTVFYAALITKHDLEAPVFVNLCTEVQLQSYLKNGPTNEASYLRNDFVNKALTKLIWTPIEAYLSKTEQIKIAPSGLISQIAFHALQDESGKQLIHKYSFEYFDNLKNSMDASKSIPTNKVNICLVGGVLFGNDWESELLASRSVVELDSIRGTSFKYLAGTIKEVKQIERMFKDENHNVNTMLNDKASEINFRNFVEQDTAYILHIATHGFFFPLNQKASRRKKDTGESRIKRSKNPLLRSGLALANINEAWKTTESFDIENDGILTAAEIAEMDLSATDLVVLSACETGLGDTHSVEGVFGLQRAFRSAGVRSMLLSLWKIPDAQTADLMQLFYTNYLAGDNKVLALQKAQQNMSEKYDPYYWAAFVLIR